MERSMSSILALLIAALFITAKVTVSGQAAAAGQAAVSAPAIGMAAGFALLKASAETTTPKCTRSTIAGYRAKVDLSGTGFFLHWAKRGSSVAVAVEAKAGSGAEKGWMMVAWSLAGGSVPSDSIFGNLMGKKSVAAFSMQGESQSGTGGKGKDGPMSFDLGKSSYSVDMNGAMMRFSRNQSDGSVPVSFKGTNKIRWAYSPNAMALISNQVTGGTALVNFACQLPKRIGGKRGVSCFGSPKAGCSKSELMGFTSVTALGNGLSLHWKVNRPQSISLALHAREGSAAAAGWFAMGWSQEGSMFPADGVAGNVAGSSGVTRLAIAGYSYAQVRATTRFKIGMATATSNNGVLLKFSRNGTDGVVPVRYLGANQIIWACSGDRSRSMSGHAGNRGTKLVDFSCNPSCTV